MLTAVVMWGTLISLHKVDSGTCSQHTKTQVKWCYHGESRLEVGWFILEDQLAAGTSANVKQVQRKNQNLSVYHQSSCKGWGWNNMNWYIFTALNSSNTTAVRDRNVYTVNKTQHHLMFLPITPLQDLCCGNSEGRIGFLGRNSENLMFSTEK